MFSAFVSFYSQPSLHILAVGSRYVDASSIAAIECQITRSRGNIFFSFSFFLSFLLPYIRTWISFHMRCSTLYCTLYSWENKKMMMNSKILGWAGGRRRRFIRCADKSVLDMHTHTHTHLSLWRGECGRAERQGRPRPARNAASARAAWQQ